MKRVVAAVALVALLFAAVHQSFRYHRMEREISAMEARQSALFEDNKRLIAAVSLLTSPARIVRLAEEELGMVRTPAEAERRLRLDLPPADASRAAGGAP